PRTEVRRAGPPWRRSGRGRGSTSRPLPGSAWSESKVHGMRLFDANCMLGRRSIHSPLEMPTTAAELLAEMDRLRRREAVGYDGVAVDGHAGEGNQRLMREIREPPAGAGTRRLHPCWVLLPTAGELPAPAELVARMRAEGVRAARMFPTRHRYLFTQANVGDL